MYISKFQLLKVSGTLFHFSGHKVMPSVSDSVFNDGSTLRSASESECNESDDDPLDEYETQYFGFPPKSFMNGGK